MKDEKYSRECFIMSVKKITFLNAQSSLCAHPEIDAEKIMCTKRAGIKITGWAYCTYNTSDDDCCFEKRTYCIYESGMWRVISFLILGDEN